ncbi:MAG: septum formation inhibitor Maf [Candidatus Solibacter usitatus]|nr:septum formation inhibitor Maf [Candidatus Solibacter usitatus]
MIVLASQSPRRRELLAQAGFTFIVRAPAVEELHQPGESPAAYVERLAAAKAAAVQASGGASDDEWILAADTTVVVDAHILEKPTSPADAARMLRLLSGRDHFVLTAVCLRQGSRQWSAVESTLVRFSPLSESEIIAYAASGEPLDKAGAYAIQGLASRFIPRIEGCYFNVVGLPISLVYRLLRDAGYPA